jgi:ribosomal protein S18 acetylase RimI-like enzyme
MFVEQTITWLEMTSPAALRPGRPPPAPLALQVGDGSVLSLVRSTCTRIGQPHGWTSRPSWSEEQWARHLARPEVQAWIALAGGEAAGMIELEARPGAEVEITIFGLVPEFVGRGFGGHLLTLATRLAWELPHPEGTAIRRVWLHTSSLDHAHALGNYRARGFRMVRTEDRPRPVPPPG